MRMPDPPTVGGTLLNCRLNPLSTHQKRIMPLLSWRSYRWRALVLRSTWRLDWEKGWDGVKCNWSQIRSNARQEDNYRGLPRPEISKTWHSPLMMAKTAAKLLTQTLSGALGMNTNTFSF